jgi:hypothetical protein
MKAKGKRQKVKGKTVRTGLLSMANFLLIFSFLLFPFALSSCGKKGDPRPPELAMPQTIKDLKARPDKSGIALTWSRPRAYVDGKELRDLAGFVIFRKELSKSCPDCPAPYRELATVNVEDQERFVQKKQYGFVDQEIRPQTVYRYRVFSKLMDGSLSEPSNEAEAGGRP